MHPIVNLINDPDLLNSPYHLVFLAQASGRDSLCESGFVYSTLQTKVCTVNDTNPCFP